MVRNQDIYKMTTEELLKSIEVVSLDLPLPTSNDVGSFISTMRLSRGVRRISFRFLYSIYRLWSLKPTKRSIFGAELKKRFKCVRNRYEVYYLINPRGLPKQKLFL